MLAELLFIFGLFISSNAAPQCLKANYTYDETLQICYKWTTLSPETFIDAENDCENDGGHLISIHSQEENEYIAKKLIRGFPTFIGLIYDRAEQKYHWTDGTNVDFQNNLESGTPESDCFELNSVFSSLWISQECTQHTSYLCKLSTSSSTTPQVGTTTTAPSTPGFSTRIITTTSAATTTLSTTPLTGTFTSTIQPGPSTTVGATTNAAFTTTTTTTPYPMTSTSTSSTTHTTTTRPKKCPAGFITDDAVTNKCLYVQDSDSAKADYFSAKRFCTGKSNATPLTIKNGFENSHIRDLITISIWIGLINPENETWGWDDGESWTYRNWAPNQPDVRYQCAIFDATTAQWSSKDCDSKYPFICQLLL